MKEKERLEIYKRAEYAYDLFKSLPDRAQKMWFEYCGISINMGKLKNLDFIHTHLYGLETYLSDCKSPIEILFWFAFELMQYDIFGDSMMWLMPQFEVPTAKHNYYVDFAVDGVSGLNIAIECDGHDFHEKTKEQVAHDNERDYNLKMAGWDILHFSGSQIYNAPFKCARQTINYVVEEYVKHKDGRC